MKCKVCGLECEVVADPAKDGARQPGDRRRRSVVRVLKPHQIPYRNPETGQQVMRPCPGAKCELGSRRMTEQERDKRKI